MNNKKGNAASVVLFIISGIMLTLAALALLGITSQNKEIEDAKKNLPHVEGIVEELKYDNENRHYVALVLYAVDGEEYEVELDNATSNNKPGTYMTVYYDSSDPSYILNEPSMRETSSIYVGIIIFAGGGIGLIILGIAMNKSADKRIRNLNNMPTGYNSVSPVAYNNVMQTYKGYDGGLDPSQPYNQEMNQNNGYYNPNMPYTNYPGQNPQYNNPQNNNYPNNNYPPYNNY